jgi:hypothetical protein
MSDDNSYQHKFRLRGDYEIELTLPKDLKMTDVHRLTQWLQTLPFDNRRTRDTATPRMRGEGGPTESASHGLVAGEDGGNMVGKITKEEK